MGKELLITPCDMSVLNKKNVYKNVCMCKCRARQICETNDKKLEKNLWGISGFMDSFHIKNNSEVVTIVRHYERIMKPSIQSINEFKEGYLYLT